MGEAARPDRRPWQRDELLLAMNLYCKLPFGRLHHRTPEIIRLADALGRTAGTLAHQSKTGGAYASKALPSCGR